MNIKTNKRSNIHTACFPRSLRLYVNDVQILRSAVLWDNLQRKVVLPYLSFGTTYYSHLPDSISCLDTLKMESIGCPETSVWKYQSTLRNIPEERRSHLRRGEGLKSGEKMLWLNVCNDYKDNINYYVAHKRQRDQNWIYGREWWGKQRIAMPKFFDVERGPQNIRIKY